MHSKEFAFCNKILYTHHPYLSDHKNVQLSTVSYKKKKHTHTHKNTVSKKLLCREHASQCLLRKAKYTGTVKDLQT